MKHHRDLFFSCSLLALLAAGCTSSSTAPAAGGAGAGGKAARGNLGSAAAATPSTVIRVAFGASFENGGDCQKASRSGCDVLVAEYDMASKKVLSVEPVATGSLTQDFPAQEIGGNRILFQQLTRPPPAIAYATPGGSSTVLIERGGHPYLSTDGTMLAYDIYTGQKREAAVRSIDFSTDPPTLGTPQKWSGDEPYILPGNQYAAYYLKGDAPKTGQTRIRNLKTGEDTAMSLKNGCAHGAVNYSGTRIFCQQGYDIYSRTFDGTNWGELETSRFPEVSDPAYADCDQITYGHAEFCGDDDHLLTTYTCYVNGRVRTAQLMISTWDGSDVTLFSRQVGELLGKKGAARSGVCSKL